MDFRALEKRNKAFEGDIRRELLQKVEDKIELTETESKVLAHLEEIREAEEFMMKTRNI